MIDPRDLPDKDALLEQVKGSRAHWQTSAKPARIEPVGPGQESVWAFPRPPAVEPVAAGLRVEHRGSPIAETARGLRVIETAGAPVYYFPPDDVRTELLHPTRNLSVCEWKGVAVHFDIALPGGTVRDGAFTYPDPFDDLGQGYDQIAGWIGFYASRLDGCFIGAEQVTPQPGGFYAGWVTQDLTGPIKGEPGSSGW